MITANLVRTLHYLILAFAVFTPIFGNEFFLSLHVIAMPTMIFHWITNQNACSLTLLESHLRGKKCDKTFVAEVLYPFFSMGSDHIIYTLAVVWWLISLWKLREYNFGLLRMCFSKTWTIFKRFCSWIVSFARSDTE